MAAVESQPTTDSSEAGRVEIRFPSDPAYMSAIRRTTTVFASLAGLSPADADSVTLAVDEACTNIIKHAYHYDFSRQIILSFELLADRLQISLRDFGIQCEPADLRGRPLDDVRPGGLGLHIIHDVMDLVEYDTRHALGTELRMTRFLSR